MLICRDQAEHKVPPLRFASVGMTSFGNRFGRDDIILGVSAEAGAEKLSSPFGSPNSANGMIRRVK
jgi:hypothetical protein